MTEAAQPRVTTKIVWDLEFDITLSSTEIRFRDGLKRREIEATRCAHCRWVFVPPRPFCERCCEPADEWVRVADRGTLVSYTEVFLAPRGTPTPFVLGVIRLDGVDGLMLHYLGGLEERRSPAEQLTPGMPVEAVWKSEPIGDLLDIECFRPVRHG